MRSVTTQDEGENRETTVMTGAFSCTGSTQHRLAPPMLLDRLLGPKCNK
jgi:hypothetical protein